MIKIKYAFAFLIVMLTVTFSCKKDEDDGPTPVPPRDRGVEAARAQTEIEAFLATHFYNYEEFQSPPADFDYLIKFDTIAGDNASKTPLMDQVDFKDVKDVFDNSVTYKLYYLKVNQGAGDKPHFADGVTLTYDGRLMNLDLFDSSVIPAKLDLTDTPLYALVQALLEFNGAGTIITNPDGSLSFEDYGIGAVFIPSGLGYFQYPPGNTGLNSYDQLIFSFQLFDANVLDHDADGIPSYMEDLNNNEFLLDDNTDGDNLPNYQDDDDDNDGRFTSDEIIIENGTITFPDTDGDGTPDYLDKDS